MNFAAKDIGLGQSFRQSKSSLEGRVDAVGSSQRPNANRKRSLPRRAQSQRARGMHDDMPGAVPRVQCCTLGVRTPW